MLARFGLLTLAAAVFTGNVLLNVPYTLNSSYLYTADSICVVLSFIAFAA